MNEIEKLAVERFIRYAKIDTQSDVSSPTGPSTEKQLVLLNLLKDELTEMGASNVRMGKGGVVYALIPGNVTDKKVPAVGFSAHTDTTPDASGTNVRPWLYENYPGGDVVLNKEKNIVLEADKFPNMAKYIGQDMLFSDGTTVVGGDDKAAVTSLMMAVDYLLKHPELKHGDIPIAFTPDEEIGRGTVNFDIPNFGAELCYTLDGDGLGNYMYETFNAEEAQLHFYGLSVHPGTAKGKMINAVEMAGEFMSMLPALERPQFTELREGFYHPFVLEAVIDKAFMRCLIRDHEPAILAERRAYIERCVRELNKKYGEGAVELTWRNKYCSMREAVMKVPFMIDYLKQAYTDCGVEPKEFAFRGGTDGARLTMKGLTTPNISAGYENAHGNYECVSVQSMVKNIEVIVRLAQIYAENA